MRSFTEKLAKLDWGVVFSHTDVSSKVNALEGILIGLMDDCFPVRSFRVRSDDPPWMTHGIKKRLRSERKSSTQTKKDQRDGKL